MAAENDRPLNLSSKERRRATQTGSIFRRSGTRWGTTWFSLPERQIAAQHGKSVRREGLRNRDQQGRLAVRACAVRDHEARPSGRGRVMKKSSDAVLRDRSSQ
jgi:hypothetical protein